MKIHAYIQKHQITPVIESECDPTPMPSNALSRELMMPTFAGANSDRSIFVNTYEETDLFVVLIGKKQRIEGKISQDSRLLDS